jgi:hypothetical protein
VNRFCGEKLSFYSVPEELLSNTTKMPGFNSGPVGGYAPRRNTHRIGFGPSRATTASLPMARTASHARRDAAGCSTASPARDM